MTQRMLEASVAAGESGPVIMLAGDGSLALLHPQRPVAKVLAPLGVDQMVTIRGGAEATPGPQPRAGGTHS